MNEICLPASLKNYSESGTLAVIFQSAEEFCPFECLICIADGGSGAFWTMSNKKITDLGQPVAGVRPGNAHSPGGKYGAQGRERAG